MRESTFTLVRAEHNPHPFGAEENLYKHLAQVLQGTRY